MSRKLILTATVAAAVCAAAPAADAAFPGQNGPILFAGSTSTEQQAIFSMPFGGAASPLLQTQGWADGIESSADGKRIAYNDEFVIWTANSDGSGAKALTPEGEEDFAPSWSPDGTKIVFSSVGEGGFTDMQLWTMNADGTNRQPLLVDGDPVFGYQPAYSPDGTRLAFTELSLRARGGSAGIYVANADGSEAEIVAEGREPEWTPDGRSLVYVEGTWRSYGPLARIDLDREDGPVQLTSPEQDEGYRAPSVSPDGTKIVAEFEAALPVRGDRFDEYGMVTMNADGSGLVRVDRDDNPAAPEWTAVPKRDEQPDDEKPAPQGQQPAPPVAQQQPQQQAVVRSATPSRSCGSRRFFTINVRGKQLAKVSVVVNGKRVTTKRKSGAFTARVDLRKLPRGRFTVKIRKTLEGGAIRNETRRYRTCVPKAQS